MDLEWAEQDDRSHLTEVDEFVIRLYPQSRGRRLVTVNHKDGYSRPTLDGRIRSQTTQKKKQLKHYTMLLGLL